MLEKQQIEKYQAELEQEKRRLLVEIEKEQPEDFGSDVDHFDEEADEAEDEANKLAIKDTLKDRLEEIESALLRIKHGTYGVCVKCGKDIEKEVLDLVPESDLCEECKKEMM